MSLFVILVGLFANFVKRRLFLVESLLAAGIGLALGPYAANLFAPFGVLGTESDVQWEFLVEATRIVIIFQAFNTGLAASPRFIKRHLHSCPAPHRRADSDAEHFVRYCVVMGPGARCKRFLSARVWRRRTRLGGSGRARALAKHPAPQTSLALRARRTTVLLFLFSLAGAVTAECYGW